jgi:hypothetical protein
MKITENSFNDTTKQKQKKTSCFGKNPYFNEDPASITGKLFVYSENIIGLVTNSDLSIRFYSINVQQKQITLLFTKYFRTLVPYAACVDKNKNIYIVFPDSHTIGKFVLGKSGRQLEEVLAIKESDYSPTAVSCSNNQVYVSERPTNIIRVYDENLEVLRTIKLDDVVVSAHRTISVNRNANVFVDDSSAVGFFTDTTDLNTDYLTGDPFNTVSDVCHFYMSKNCIEDANSYTDHIKHKTHVNIVNSCSKEVLQYEYHSMHKNLTLVNVYKTEGIPISVVQYENGHLYVLTSVPYRIDVFSAECKLNSLNPKLRIRNN